jgi:hypothetical protein
MSVDTNNTNNTQYMQTLKQLHDTFYGPQDKYDAEALAKMNKPRFDLNVKDTRTFTFYSPPYGSKFVHYISREYGYKNKEGKTPYSQYACEAYTNFRITPSSAISDISLEVGGQRFERPSLYKFLNKDIEFSEMSNGNALPALANSSNKIIFETNCECQVTISYDVISYLNPDETTEVMIHSEQFTGTKTINSKNSKIKLNYNHPITEIYAFLPPNTIDARILLNDEDYNLILTKKDNYYHIYFGDETSINFSRVDVAFLKLTLEDDTEYGVSVVAINKHLIRRMSGMAGMSWTK